MMVALPHVIGSSNKRHTMLQSYTTLLIREKGKLLKQLSTTSSLKVIMASLSQQMQMGNINFGIFSELPTVLKSNLRS